MNPFPFAELITWYKKNGRKNLPWRNYDFDEKTLAYRVWLSEVLLQQTQAARGVTYFENIIKAFPDVETLARSDYDTFFHYYKGLGYYNRAKNLLKTAQIISQTYGGFVPRETEKLVALPGVGPYTAEAIRAFAFKIPTLSFDTNLEKIFSRYFHGSRFVKLTKAEKETILRDFLEIGISSRDFNNACMDFGALVSLNNKSKIDFDTYPLPDDIFATTKGKLEPEKKKKISSFPKDEAEIHVILHEAHREYFSENEAEFTPFILEKTDEKDKRAYIKKYFLERYGLELSVRPAHEKNYDKKKPYMSFNAQVQTGTHDFFVYKKGEL